MRLAFILIGIFFSSECSCQNSYQYSAQTLNYTLFKIIKAESIKRDSVFVYGKRKNNNDSILIMTDFFDSSGFLLEKDQYGPTKELERIINYTYSDTVLFQQETLSHFTKNVKTYYYDSIGNNIIVKENTYIGDSMNSGSVTIFKREYDNDKHLINEFRTLPKGLSLYHSWIYSDGRLSETKTYDIKQTLTDWYTNEYDDKLNSKKVFDNIKRHTLSFEYFYDSNKNLIIEKSYQNGQGYLGHTTITFQYDSNGLLIGEIFQDTNGEYAYIKVIYSKK